MVNKNFNVISNPDFSSSDNSQVTLFGSSNISQLSVEVKSTYDSNTMGINWWIYNRRYSLQSDGITTVSLDSALIIVREYSHRIVYFLLTEFQLNGIFKLQERLGGSVSNSQVPSGSGVLIEVKERQQILLLILMKKMDTFTVRLKPS